MVSTFNQMSLVIDEQSRRLKPLLVQTTMLHDDWQRIQSLDHDFRVAMTQLLQADKLTESDKVQLRESVQALQLLYQQVIGKCEEYRAGLRGEMESAKKGRKGIRAYQAV